MIFSRKNKFEDLEFPKSVEVLEKVYFIEVVFLPKKSSSVVINGETIIFRMSSFLSKKVAMEHFSSLFRRIYKKLELNVKHHTYKGIKEVLEEGSFVFAGENYLVEQTNKVKGVKLRENIFFVNYKTKLDAIEKYFVKYLILRYEPRVLEYVRMLNERSYNYDFKEVKLKLVRSKWGHCSHDNKLMFNLKLLNAPQEVFDYVIFHEIAHIKVKNHSARFWAEVARFCPEHAKLRKELKSSSPGLFV